MTSGGQKLWRRGGKVLWRPTAERPGVWAITVGWGTVDGLSEPVSLSIEPHGRPGRLEARSLKALPLGEAVRLSRSTTSAPRPRPVKRLRPGQRLGDDHYRKVAEEYRRAREDPETRKAPTQAVADHFGRPHSTAARWVNEASARGFLVKSRRGVPRGVIVESGRIRSRSRGRSSATGRVIRKGKQ